jgi:hypothetical protein
MDSSSLTSFCPEITGRPIYQFGNDCRLIGVAYSDKILSASTTREACHVIERTWYFKDWCDTETSESSWWNDVDQVSDQYIQRIEIIDSVPPMGNISFTKTPKGFDNLGNCVFEVNAFVHIYDDCGLSRFDYTLDSLARDRDITVDAGGRDISELSDDLVKITWLARHSGTFKLKVRMIDQCGLESYGIDTFTISDSDSSNESCTNESSSGVKSSTLNLIHLIKSSKKAAFTLHQNQPNPFFGHTKIHFDLFEAGLVKFSLRDTNGVIIRSTENHLEPGSHQIEIHDSDLQSSGIYYYQLTTKNQTGIKRMILLQ